MVERKHSSKEKETNFERSSQDIRDDIANEKENISRTVDEISERIKEKTDWREYVKDSPFLAIGAAAGLGYLASRVFITRTTPTERIVKTVAEGVHDSLDSLHAQVSRPGLITMALLTMATKAAADWIKNASFTAETADGDAGPQPQRGRDSTINGKMEP
ncbi:hypothetical protein [Desulfosarcina sp.]|uniref:hypothetical protein n=1 Tax=Desulfosarcina sp. TaxID=2027861 RepID=UPI003970645A